MNLINNLLYRTLKTNLRAKRIPVQIHQAEPSLLIPQDYQHRLILAAQSRSFRSIVMETGQKSV